MVITNPHQNNYPGHQPNIESILQPSMRDGIIKGRPFFILADEIKDGTAYYTVVYGSGMHETFSEDRLRKLSPEAIGNFKQRRINTNT